LIVQYRKEAKNQDCAKAEEERIVIESRMFVDVE